MSQTSSSRTRAARLLALPLVGALVSCSVGTTQVATAENTYMGHSTGELSARLVDPLEVPGAVPAGPAPTTHGSVSRTRLAQLESELDQILALTQPEVAALHDELEAALATYSAPEKLATQQPGLTHWHEAERDAHQARIALSCDETKRRLKLMEQIAIEAGIEQARSLAPERVAMDAGYTGDSALDAALEQFTEVLDGALLMSDLEVRCSQESSKVVELFEVFNSFGIKEPDGTTAAEDRMQGRLLLFVGGDETGAAPRALFAFRDHAGAEPRTRTVAQVTRHRIMRGQTIVADYGWRPAPIKGGHGLPATEVVDNYLIAPAVEPILNRAADAYDQLRDLRVQVDIQTGVFEADGTPIGGVDWRLEFHISARGDLTWQLEAGRPVYDPYCAEIVKVIALAG